MHTRPAAALSCDSRVCTAQHSMPYSSTAHCVTTHLFIADNSTAPRSKARHSMHGIVPAGKPAVRVSLTGAAASDIAFCCVNTQCTQSMYQHTSSAHCATNTPGAGPQLLLAKRGTVGVSCCGACHQIPLSADSDLSYHHIP
jgi:hypothetical protein